MKFFNVFSGKSRVMLLSLAVGATAWQCKSFEGAQVTCKPNPLEVHSDSVKFTVRATIPAKSGFKKGGIYNGNLAIENAGAKFGFKDVSISSTQFPDIKKTGASATVTASKPFEQGMDGGMLKAFNSYTRKGKTFDLPAIDLAPCCITTSTLLCEDAKFITAPFNYEKQKPLTLEAKFQFPQNVHAIQPTEYEKAEIRAIGDFLKNKYVATRINISGFASPEGQFKRNQFLSVARSKEVQNWLIEQLKKEGYDAYLDSSFFVISTTSEDWDGFKDNLCRKSFPEDVKRQIIDIISAGYDPAVTERRVMALVGGADEVEDILAPLRRATIKLEGMTSSHPDALIDQTLSDFLAGKITYEDASKFFKQEELLFAISRLENRNDKIKALTGLYIKQYGSDWRGYNDLGVYNVQGGSTDNGLSQLQSAEKQKAGVAIVHNNMGAAYLLQKRYNLAMEPIKNARQGAGSKEASFNSGYLMHKLGRYAEAAESFNQAVDLKCAKYNAGLAKLLMGDLAGAKADFEAAVKEDKNNARAYYLIAILGARSADSNLVVLNLKRAVQIDSSLGAKASKDLEFRNYFNDEQFKSALK